MCARVLCDYLTIMGLIQKAGEIYTHSLHQRSISRSAFARLPRPRCARFHREMPAMQDPLHHPGRHRARRPHRTLPGDGSVEPDNPVWVEFARSMKATMAG